jgi:nucleoside-diphosphate-sugar epimerase
VITSSGGAVVHFPVPAGYTFTADDWNTQASPDEPYFYSKRLAEQAAWDWSKQNSEVEVVVVNPGFVQGPSLGELELLHFHAHVLLARHGKGRHARWVRSNSSRHRDNKQRSHIFGLNCRYVAVGDVRDVAVQWMSLIDILRQIGQDRSPKIRVPIFWGEPASVAATLSGSGTSSREVSVGDHSAATSPLDAEVTPVDPPTSSPRSSDHELW